MKIKLGERPINFRRTLKVPLPDGQTGEIEVSYIYRTRKEFGAFRDERIAVARANSEKLASGETSIDTWAAIQAMGVDVMADELMLIIDGWGLDTPFSREAVAQLCDELPAAARIIAEDYMPAITEGRLGN